MVPDPQETKAARIIKLLLNDELASSLILAVSKNDEDAFLRTLKEFQLTQNDFLLSENELANLIKGVKTSGELDLLTWEGYYVVNDESQSDPLSFLILAGTGKMYWGPQSLVLGDPTRHVVSHKPAPDGKLEFSTPSDGLVSISLTRKAGDGSRTTTATFSGTCNGKDISGKKAPLPVDLLRLQVRSRQPVTAFLRARMVMLSDPWTNSIIVSSLSTVCGLLGGVVAGLQLGIWAYDCYNKRKKEQKQTAEEVEEGLHEQETAMTTIAEGTFNEPQIDFEGAIEEVKGLVSATVNQRLYDSPPNYTALTPDQITENLKDLASEAAKSALNDYLQKNLMPDIHTHMAKYKILPHHATLVTKFGQMVIADLVTIKIAEFDAEAFKSAVLHEVLDARKVFFLEHFHDAKEQLQSTEEEHENSKADLAKKQKQLDDVVEKIKAKKDADEAADTAEEEKWESKFTEEVDAAVAKEAERREAREKAEAAMEEAQAKKVEAETRATEDKSEEAWGEHVEKALKKG